MSLPTPFYQAEWVTLYRADCMEVLPELGTFDLPPEAPPESDGLRLSTGRRAWEAQKGKPVRLPAVP